MKPEQELLPNENVYETAVDKQRLAFGFTILGERRLQSASGKQEVDGRKGRVNVVLFCGPKASFSG